MPDKATTAVGYGSEHVVLVRATCLYAATKLGDLMGDLVVVGGLVPGLLIDQEELAGGAQAHVGTMDLDLGMALALLDHERYRALTERLRRAGFAQDLNHNGQPTRQRWKIEHRGPKVTVDFLIPPSRPGDQGGRLRDIEPDFAAIIAPGLQLAFRDRRRVTLSGLTIVGEEATRDVWVCGPGAYVALKALAFELRGENKDAYDLYYVIRNFGAGVEDVATPFRQLLDDEHARQALSVLRRDFGSHEGLGPRRVAQFLTGGPDEEVQADVVSFVNELLQGMPRAR